MFRIALFDLFNVIGQIACANIGNELLFDSKTYKVRPLQILKSIEANEVLAFDINVVWTRQESLDEYELIKVCKTSQSKPGKIVNLKLKNREVDVCIFKDNTVTFATRIYQKIPFFHIHHFKFSQGTEEPTIARFFRKVTYDLQNETVKNTSREIRRR